MNARLFKFHYNAKFIFLKHNFYGISIYNDFCILDK